MSENPGVDLSAYQRVGAETGVRSIIDDFVDRIFDDIMIGFFFRDANRARIKELEFQHACEFLGGPQRYRGRPLREAHGGHPIMGGHFARRLQILRQVLAKHGVPPEIAAAWVEHNAALRGEVTQQGLGECID
jgi:hemoglobin